MLDEAISSLIADIYGGAHDMLLWNRTMTAIGDRLDAQFLMVATADRKRHAPAEMNFFHVRHDRFDDAIKEYVAEAHRFDPSIRHAAAHPSGGVFDSVQQIGPAAYLDHPYVRWNTAKGGSMFWTTLHQASTGDLSFGISLHRSPGSGPVTGDDAAQLSLLFDHIRNAITLAAQLPFLDNDEPTLLLDAGGYVVATNEAARDILDAGTALTLVDRRLRAAHRTSTTKLDAAVKAVLAPMGSQMALMLEQDGGSRLICDIRILHSKDRPFSTMRPSVVVRLIDPEVGPTGHPEVWQALFGLTPAETRLAMKLLASNQGLSEAAMQLRIAYGTARVQLASLFNKTGVSSQAQLIQLLTRLR